MVIDFGFGAREVRRSRYHPIELFRAVGRWYPGHDSLLAFHVIKDPGSWQCMEIIYRNKPRAFSKWFPGIADRIFLSSKACKATRNRRDIATVELAELINKHALPSEEFSVISLGSGPAHDVVSAFCSLPYNYRVFGTCIDTDDDALDYGRTMANDQKLSHVLEYLKADVTRLTSASREYDVCSIIGLIEYLSSENAVKFLLSIKNLLKPHGRIILSNMREHSLTKIMDFFGRWVLDYKQLAQLEQIAVECGFEIEKSFYDPENLHSFVIARKSPHTTKS